MEVIFTVPKKVEQMIAYSTTCVFHGGKASAEYGACRSILIVICSRC